MGISKKILKTTIYNYIGSIAGSIVSFITFFYLTRNLSVEQFGQYNLVLSTQTFFMLLTSFGMPMVILRYLPEFIVKNQYIIVRKILLISTAFVLIFGLLVSLISGLLANLFPDIINKFFIAQFLLFSAFLGFLRVEVRIYESAFNAFLVQGYKISFEILGSIIKLLLFILAIRFGLGIMGIILGIGLVDVFLTFAYSAKIWHYASQKESNLGQINYRRMTSYGVKEYLTKFFAFFWDARVDAYIITFYLGVASTGIFYFVLNLVTVLAEYMPGSVMQPISQAVFTRQYTKNSDKKELAYLFSLNNKLKAFFIFPIFIAFAILIDKIVMLFFPKYLISIKLFPIVIFFMLFYVFLMPLRNIVATLEKNEISLLANITMLYKIPAAIILTRYFGLTGTALAVGSSFFLYYFIHIVFVKKFISIRYPWKAFFKITVNSICASGVLLFLHAIITNTYTLLIAILLFVLVYLLASLLNKAFDEYDRKIINKPFNRIIFNF